VEKEKKMKIYFCLLIMLIGFVFNISAQSTFKLRTDVLFEKAATLIAEENNLSISTADLKDYGRKVASSLDGQENPEREAAVLLLELLGNNPLTVIRSQEGTTQSSKYTLNADVLTIEYLKVLVVYCSRGRKDPLKLSIDEMDTNYGRYSVNQELSNELRKSSSKNDYEEAFAERMIAAKEEIDKMGLGNFKNWTRTKRRLFFPLCLLFRNC
jgi:hypothetical protein